MDYKTKIKINTSITDAVLKADEFVKEYWGHEVFYSIIDGKVMRNSEIFTPQLQIDDDLFSFFTYININDYKFLANSEYKRTPERTEVFKFSFDLQSVELQFYNSFETDERYRQFQKITENFTEALKHNLPLIRVIEKREGVIDVMCKYRRAEGRVGFSFMPYIDDNDYTARDEYIWIYMSDFKFLEPFINMNGFDYTCDNDIPKEDWLETIERIKAYNTNDIKVKAFLEYFVNWLEGQLLWSNYIEVFGNL